MGLGYKFISGQGLLQSVHVSLTLTAPREWRRRDKAHDAKLGSPCLQQRHGMRHS